MEESGTKRTFEPVKVQFGNSRQIAPIDRWTGRVLDISEANQTDIALEVTLEFRGQRQGFVVHGSIDQKGFPIESLEKKVKAALISGLPKRVLWNFFKPVEIFVAADSPEIQVSEAESSIDDIVAPDLEKQALRASLATKDWEKAIQDLQEGVRDFQYRRSEVYDALSFLERCSSAANHGFLSGWYDEKLGRIRSALDDLSKRKNPRHATYVGRVDEIRGYLFHFHPINSWYKEPPRRPSN